jgi:hypothetical protein
MELAVLDYQPDLLAPRAALQRLRGRFGPGGGPVAVSRDFRLVADADGPGLEVHDRVRGVTRRFGLTPASLGLLRQLSPGGPAPPLDGFVTTVLVDAGVLAPMETEPEDVIGQARASFAADGFATVGDAIHPYEVAAIRRYLRRGVRTGAIGFGDPQVPRRFRAHNDPMLRAHQERLTGMVAAVVGRPVKPSYAYLSAYTEGSVLHRHVDRPQCEYSLTILVDYTPEPTLESDWPIRLALPGREVLVYQGLGDALVYAGRRVEHFREKLPAGHISTSLLLHYVDADFTGTLD